ncbi:hypothetical protein VOLCADRAFT_107435 [Volvox carteri f. nagariensis]|uniref:Uncharacterized protein n=1 Tax=Volvox carteri f. nagariensis TaxID=3068 RepID=D8UE03_VOLCA|nr:uncharacterized protein VOLCADRAFT_107435 [Volvox carteri f. nagariensis]EFJ42042.1 hypothetical protein VOLCADRAFT_107435 [Volvox carteri f. nagariensis]|eukprot:XP_002956917.1 hypothetical protein VOLCADRAFT_107435 [Volvox carteri f. nagariensis]
MAKALKEHRFDDALENARTAMALEPNNVMIKEFVRLLEEKQALAETDDDSDTEGATTAPAGTAASDEESEDEDEDGTDEGETDGEGSEESEESEEDDPEVLNALERLRLAGPADIGKPGPRQITPAKRYAMRASLRASIKELLLAELAKEMALEDPLLRK